MILRDERRQVADCLDSLTDAQRECIQLAYYDGLTYAQVSGAVVGKSCDDQVTDARRHPRPAQVSGARMTEPTDRRSDRPRDAVRAARGARAELADIERRVAAAPRTSRAAFADEVRAVRETMAVVSAATAVEPPDQLRDRLLTAVSERSGARAAPGGSSAGRPMCWRPQPRVDDRARRARRRHWRMRPAPTPSTAEQVFAAPDVRTVSGEIPTGGTGDAWCSPARRTPACW